MKQTRNVWKVLFIFLLTVNILLLASLLYPFLKVPPEAPSGPPVTWDETSDPIVLQISKDTLAHFLKSQFTGWDDSFKLSIDEQLQLSFEPTMLGWRIPLEVHLSPQVEQDGSLSLIQESLSFGSLPIPETYALQYIANTVELPSWVFIQPKEKKIRIDVQDYPAATGWAIYFQAIDLQEDWIELKLGIRPN